MSKFISTSGEIMGYQRIEYLEWLSEIINDRKIIHKERADEDIYIISNDGFTRLIQSDLLYEINDMIRKFLDLDCNILAVLQNDYNIYYQEKRDVFSALRLLLLYGTLELAALESIKHFDRAVYYDWVWTTIIDCKLPISSCERIRMLRRKNRNENV